MILLTFMVATLVIPVVGLGIDGSIVYWLKAKLSAAVDAAALAAGRSLSVGLTLSAQETSATQTAQEYFAADFQPGSMGTTVINGNPTANQPTVTFAQTGTHTRTVSVQATATVPLYFMRILGFNTATMSATGQATRRDANVVLIIDRSYSMQLAGACSTMIASAQNFVNYFVDGRDELGLVTFQSTANVDYASTIHFKSNSPSLNTVLGTAVCTGYTTTASALSLAYNQITNVINQPGALNVIVLFTDGQPDSIVGNFAIKTQADTRYGWSNTGTPTATPASSCTGPGPLTGVVIGDYGTPDPTGPTAGVFNPAPVAINSNLPDTNSIGVPVPPVISAPGCVFANGSSSDKVRLDVAALPATDAFGNSLSGYKPLDYYGAGNYSGLIRIDTPRAIVNAAINTADNEANTIRSDTTFTPIIYTIGLGGTPVQQIDSDFLERVANDQRASSYNPNQPTGEFIYANAGTLASAFQQIASQILRLSQ